MLDTLAFCTWTDVRCIRVPVRMSRVGGSLSFSNYLGSIHCPGVSTLDKVGMVSPKK